MGREGGGGCREWDRGGDSCREGDVEGEIGREREREVCTVRRVQASPLGLRESYEEYFVS